MGGEREERKGEEIFFTQKGKKRKWICSNKSPSTSEIMKIKFSIKWERKKSIF
jgi:hypothetical protein